MKTARHLMTPEPHTIRSGDRLHEVMHFFLAYQVHYAPVLSPMGELLGLLSDISVVKASLRKYLSSEIGESIYAHRDLFEPAATVRDSARLDEIVRVMMKSSSRRVLVLDQGQQVIGILSPRDIMKVLVGKTDQLNEMHTELKDLEFKTRQLELEVQSIQQLMGVYREIFEASPLIMHSVDENGAIVMANRKAHEALGYNGGELIGKSIFDLYPHPVHDQARRGLETIKETGAHASTMTSMVRKDQSMLNVDLVSSALRSPKGVFLGTITAARPVDESRALLEAVQELMNAKNPASA